ncbi:hypothetical protein AB0L25_38880, partial [Spirillospora sp. NPDC052242]
MRVIDVLLILAGVIGAFVAYNASLSQSDLRDIVSSQVLATACATLAIAGAGLYIAAALAQVWTGAVGRTLPTYAPRSRRRPCSPLIGPPRRHAPGGGGGGPPPRGAAGS